MNTQQEFEALQNGAEYLKIEGLTVIVKLTNDNRKTNGKYFLNHSGITVSPVLNYDQMNHFLLGMSRMKQITETK